MVPRGAGAGRESTPAPRARGDGPHAGSFGSVAGSCSPRTRGRSRGTGNGAGRRRLLPAHAGMVPVATPAARSPRSAPRARGDGPHVLHGQARRPPCSPRTRGWSPPRAAGLGRAALLPAHAGMVPSPRGAGRGGGAAPRARGDGPGPAFSLRLISGCSPRTRGWSLLCTPLYTDTELLPAHAGMVPPVSATWPAPCSAPRARGDGPGSASGSRRSWTCSPRTRGWSPSVRCATALPKLLPAHAGMVPVVNSTNGERAAAPRARGDGPRSCSSTAACSSCSPRTRGWSPHPLEKATQSLLLPAHAGMVPVREPRQGVLTPAPRARGDGPTGDRPRQACPLCSPRTRGWSRLKPAQGGPAALLPAHAGMVPATRSSTRRPRAAPRARGDGPIEPSPPARPPSCSPRTQGRLQREVGFPALPCLFKGDRL